MYIQKNKNKTYGLCLIKKLKIIKIFKVNLFLYFYPKKSKQTTTKIYQQTNEMALNLNLKFLKFQVIFLNKNV
jgi:hypothetical protein